MSLEESGGNMDTSLLLLWQLNRTKYNKLDMYYNNP